MAEEFDKQYNAAVESSYQREKLRLAEEVGKTRAVQEMEGKPQEEGALGKVRGFFAKLRASGIGERIRNAPGIQLGVQRDSE